MAREGDQPADGGAEGGVAQRLGEGAGVLVALPDESREVVQGGVEVALDGEVAGHPGAGEAEFARLPQEVAQGAPVAYDQGRGVGGTGLGAVPGADADGERRADQLLEDALQP